VWDQLSKTAAQAVKAIEVSQSVPRTEIGQVGASIVAVEDPEVVVGLDEVAIGTVVQAKRKFYHAYQEQSPADLISEHTKQADQSWGAPTGESELADEKAGDAIAKEEVKEGGWDAGNAGAPGWNDSSAATESKAAGWDGGEGAPAFKDSSAPAGSETAPGEPDDPEDKHKSYADYMAEQATKKMKELGVLEPRQANEGSKQDKKWVHAKEITKGGDKEQYFQGAEGKAKRDRDRLRNAKEKLDVDFRYQEQPRGGGSGGGERGRGRGRGDRGERGEFRGRGRGRGDFGDRGDREGGFRGGRGDGYRGRGERGEFRGRGRGRGGRDGANGTGVPVAVDDEAAFPTLGSKK
jgi:plasminogen activator inhibitor 1 RNA-binding protein